MKNCTEVKKLSLKQCSYGSNFHKTYGLPNLQDSWIQPSGSAYKMRIGIYHVFIEDWLNAFPRENILFVRFEDYVKDPGQYVNTFVLPHLQIGEFSSSNSVGEDSMARVKNKNRKKPHIDDMLPETMQLLKAFYKPHNERLAKLLNNPVYLEWNN